MENQRRVAEFLDEHDIRTNPPYRVLDLASEVGELAKDVNASSEYGIDAESAAVSSDELGDTLFCVLALAAESGIDAGDALDEALAKYEARLDSAETPGSGSHDS